MKKEVLIFLFLVIITSGCSLQTYETQEDEYVSIELIELKDRECKGNAFDEIELDNLGKIVCVLSGHIIFAS